MSIEKEFSADGWAGVLRNLDFKKMYWIVECADNPFEL